MEVIENFDTQNVLNEVFPSAPLTQNSIYVIHRASTTQIANSIKHTSSTKTRSEVSGGGRKPWKQKGTGRARAGSNRSPLWRGGGVIFGPKPKMVSKKINKKEKQLALVLALKAKTKNIIVVKDFDLLKKEISTQQAAQLINNLPLKPQNTIGFLLPEICENIYLSTRNLKKIWVFNITSLNVNDILKVDYLVTTEETLRLLKQIYKNF